MCNKVTYPQNLGGIVDNAMVQYHLLDDDEGEKYNGSYKRVESSRKCNS